MNSDNDALKILEQIYEDKHENNDSRFAIQGYESRVGSIRYIDEAQVSNVPKQATSNDLDFNLYGGKSKPKKKVRANDEVLYPSLNDIPDKDVKEFLEVCHIDYITSNHKSNSIFVVPDAKGLSAIKEDISKTLGKTKPDSPEGVLAIKTSKLLYKLFILDTYGKNDNNGFQYRIPVEYPDKIADDSVIYRRTSHYEDKAFFIQLTKKGCKVSNDSDMTNAITLDFMQKIGRAPNYISFVFKGNLIPLMKSNASAQKRQGRKKKSVKRRLQELVKANEYDHEAAAYQFIGEMAHNFGVDKCAKYYGANMLQTAFSLVAAFGDKTTMDNTDCPCDEVHAQLMKAYKPKVRQLLTSTNIAKICDYGSKYSDSMISYLSDNDYARSKTYTSDRYFKQIKNAYRQIASDIKSDNEINNFIASDVAYGVYENSGNLELAIDQLNATKQALNGTKQMTSAQLSNAINMISDFCFHGLHSQQFYPMITINKSRKFEMTGGDDLELKLEGGKCDCGNCPECLRKKETSEEEPKTIDDMEKLADLI